MMSRLIALVGTACLVASVHAQSNPPGVAVPPNTPGVAGGKSENAAEARKNMRPQGEVRPQGGDQPRTAEGGGVGTDRAAIAGERRAETRDQRRPGKRKTTQGSTPK
ncbi:MAG: cell envelope biogenesis protein TolA [Proteobacteria bacterium]|nr:cell envelope biogenesis protein TolA [Pseudomonadota bacterium]